MARKDSAHYSVLDLLMNYKPHDKQKLASLSLCITQGATVIDKHKYSECVFITFIAILGFFSKLTS